MISKNKTLILFTLFVLLSLLYYYSLYYDKLDSKTFNFKIKTIKTDTYRDECMHLYKKLRFPNASLIFRPPLKKPPAEMLNDFQQNGDMPITRDFYFDESYSDSGLLKNNNKQIPVISIKEMETYRVKVRNNQPLGYGDKVLNKKSFEYKEYIKAKSVVVIGTYSPWVEAIASEVGAAKVTTVEYTRKKYEDPKLEWIHVYDFFDNALETKQIETFDAAISFSSIEHAGLGRYGDALSPYGDLDAVKQVHCMLKPGGLFLLGLPSSQDGSSYIEFNAHRIYGTKRLDILLKGWTLLEIVRSTDAAQAIYVLKK